MALDTSPPQLSSFLDSTKYTLIQEEAPPFSFAKQEDTQVNGSTLFGDDDGNTQFSSLSDSECGIPGSANINQAAAAWQVLNNGILSPSFKAMLITSANEADLTILNILAAKKGSALQFS